MKPTYIIYLKTSQHHFILSDTLSSMIVQTLFIVGSKDRDIISILNELLEHESGEDCELHEQRELE